MGNSHVNYNAGTKPKRPMGGRRDGTAQATGNDTSGTATNTISRHPAKENSEVSPGASKQSRNQ